MLKRIITSIVAVLFVCSFSLNAKPVRVNGDVTQYVNGLKDGSIDFHQSVILKKLNGKNIKDFKNKSVLLENGIKPASIDDNKVWADDSQDEYEIVNNDNFAKKIDNVIRSKGPKSNKQLVDLKGFKKQVFADESVIKYESKGKKDIILGPEAVNMDDYKEAAVAVIKNFDDIKDNVEYSLYSITKEQCLKGSASMDQYKAEHVTAIGLRFERVFNGGVVRKGMSYVKVTLNANKELVELEIKWPEFKPLTKIKKKMAKDMPLNIVKKHYETVDYAQKGMEMVGVRDIEIVGLEKGWLPLQVNGKEILTAAHTVVTKLVFEDDHEKLSYDDMPLAEEYYEMNK